MMIVTAPRKLLLIGDSSVGKSALIQRLRHNVFQKQYNPTQHTEVHRFIHGGQSWDIIDTAGQKKYGTNFVSDLQRLTHAPDHVMVMYSCASLLSYKSVQTWVESLKQTFGDSVPITIVANEVDIEHKQVQPSTTDVQVSCKTGQGIDDLFHTIL